jgi:hypothetical protein
MAIIPVTLATAGALAAVNLLLAARISLLRHPRGIELGHGDDDLLERRMRAHANFAEYAPLTALLVLAVELAAGPSRPLVAIAAILVAARAAHPFGMEGWMAGRVLGTLGTWGATGMLAAWALWLAVSALR